MRMDKIIMKNIFTSSRFWLLTIGIALQACVILKVIDGTQSESLVQLGQVFIAGIVTIRTVDRMGDKQVEAAGR